MKTVYACLLYLLVFSTGCAKSLASEDLDSVDEVKTEAFHNREAGASANDLLSSNRFTSLNVEVQYMEGYKPSDVAITQLLHFLYKHLNKPEGIFIRTKEIAATTDTILSSKDILAIEQLNRTAYSTPTQLAIYILITNGRQVNNHLLGLAYRNTSVVLLGDKIKDYSYSTRKITRSKLEATILLHEVCHLLGLVNSGSPMQQDHKDAELGRHCNNKKCLMYYAPAKENPYIYLINSKVPDLDKECLEDLIANGGK